MPELRNIRYCSKMAAEPVNPELVRLSLFEQLMDWDASDLKRVYEPISWHFSCLFCLCIGILAIAWFWGMLKRMLSSLPQYVPYARVMNSEMIFDEALSESSKKRRTCAVIGGHGFIGSHLVGRLLRGNDYRVLVLGRTIPPESKRLDEVAGYVQVDMRDYDGLVRAFANVDTVFHLGAAIPNAFVHSKEAIWDANKSAAIAVVAACRRAGVKNLIYGSGGPHTPPANDDSLHLSHLEASRLILAAHDQGNLKTSAVHMPNIVFGCGDKISTKFASGQFFIFPHLSQNFLFVYVGVLVDLLVKVEAGLAASDSAVCGKLTDLPGEKMTFQQFYALQEWGRKPPMLVPFPIFRFLALINSICAKVTRCAPFGKALCAPILDAMKGWSVENFNPMDALPYFELQDVPSTREGVQKLVSQLNVDKSRQ